MAICFPHHPLPKIAFCMFAMLQGLPLTTKPTPITATTRCSRSILGPIHRAWRTRRIHSVSPTPRVPCTRPSRRHLTTGPIRRHQVDPTARASPTSQASSIPIPTPWPARKWLYPWTYDMCELPRRSLQRDLAFFIARDVFLCVCIYFVVHVLNTHEVGVLSKW